MTSLRRGAGAPFPHRLPPRGIITAAALASLALAAPQQAQAGKGDEAVAATISKPPASARYPLIGAMLDVGLPDLVTASLVVRPWSWIRFHAGMSSDVANFGVRGGLTLMPFRTWITPSVSFEAGHVFEGNANAITKSFGVTSPVLERFGYTYANAHLGLELGNRRSFVFLIHGGMSYIDMTVRNLQQVLAEELEDGSITFADPKLKGFIPSAKLGFIVYL